MTAATEMSEIARQVFAQLDALGIAYDWIAHPPVQTIADCMPIDEKLHAVTVKNYFLSTRNRKRRFLCLVRPNARFSSGDVSRQAGASRLSFAKDEDLYDCLRVHPGAVTPLGLMFDEAHAVELLVDGGLFEMRRLAFHPCDNRFTVAMSREDFFDRFLPHVGHVPRAVEIHDFLE